MANQGRIGVLTFHRCINYGSYWQARCLVEGLQAYGYQAELLNHQSQRVNRAEWKCGLQPVLPTPVPRSDRPLYAEKIRIFFREFARLPLSPPFDLDHPDDMGDYDLVVVGSDEVWNLTHPWYGGCPLFFGEGLRTPRLISYAASIGNYDAQWGLPQPWADRLRRFEAISVRDENTRLLIEQALGISPAVVLDPCLQFPVAPDDTGKREGAPYVAVYGHNFSEPFRRQLRDWAEARGLELVSIGYRNDWAHRQWITAGPHEFAHFIARAAAVATNFFHGCVFALRNGRPLACESSSYRSFKVRCLLEQLGAERHLMSEWSPAQAYHEALSAPPDPAIGARIIALRRQSDAYLRRALAPQYQHA